MPERRSLLPVRFDDLLAFGAPGSPAVTYKDETLTYGELARQVDLVAAGLRRAGLRRGDRAVVYAEKRLETVVAMLAVAAAGGVFVPVNPQFRARQLAHVLTDCTAGLVVTTVERAPTLATALEGNPHVEAVVLVDRAPGESGAPLPEADLPGRSLHRWADLAAPGAAATGPDDADAVIDIDVAAILYTSGSTGSPKGVVLTHRNLLTGAASVAGYLEMTADDVVLSVLPLSFDAGLSQITTTLITGAHVVLVNYMLPREVVKLCARHGVTALTCVPPLWIQLVAATWPAEARSGLRFFANTGGRMPRSTLEKLRALFPQAAPFLMYGLTEAFRSTYLDPAEVDRRPDSIGKAIPNAEILVVRPDGSRCDAGEPGELVHRGALVAAGYWNDPERTAARYRPVPGVGAGSGSGTTELAVWSGDTVYRDDEGFLYFVGRTDDMIKTSGYRVSPTEIEETAYATGLVAEAVALGLPDERLGARIVLIAKPAGDDVAAADVVRAMTLEMPRYMVPHQVVLTAEIPRSMNGKFDRVELRNALQQNRFDENPDTAPAAPARDQKQVQA